MKEEFKDAIEKLAGVATVMSHKFDAFHVKFDVTSRLSEEPRSAWMTKQTTVAVAAEKISDVEQALQGLGNDLGEFTNLCGEVIVIQTKIDDVDKHMSRTT